MSRFKLHKVYRLPKGRKSARTYYHWVYSMSILRYKVPDAFSNPTSMLFNVEQLERRRGEQNAQYHEYIEDFVPPKDRRLESIVVYRACEILTIYAMRKLWPCPVILTEYLMPLCVDMRGNIARNNQYIKELGIVGFVWDTVYTDGDGRHCEAVGITSVYSKAMDEAKKMVDRPTERLY